MASETDIAGRTRARPALLVGVALAIASALAAVLGGTLGVPGEDEDAVAQRATRPNVVVIMTDDQDLRSVRVMRNVQEKLGRAGVTFANSFATFPLCCPSRATFLTGQYAHNHGVRDNGPPRGGYEAFSEEGSLPISMSRAGYRTGYIGKYLNGYEHSSTPRIPRGWDRWHVPFGSRAVKMFDYSLNENGRVRAYGSEPRDYQTDVFARRATEFISATPDTRPFFLTLAMGAPHSEGGAPPNPRPAPRHAGAFDGEPLPRPPSFNESDVSDKPGFVRERRLLDRTDVRKLTRANRDRLASLLAVDDAVARVIRTLRREQELDNTLVVFTSDNGFLLGEHRLRFKSYLYEESARVPLILRGPGIPSGVTRSQLTANIDLAPTILDVADAQPGRVIDGRSLIPFALSATQDADRDLLLENQGSFAVRTQRYFYAEHPGGERELYDLEADPFQLESRHDDPALAAVRLELARRLAQLRDCAGEGCR